MQRATESAPERPPLVFISHARLDADDGQDFVREPLLQHLKSHEMGHRLRILIDTDLPTGASWERLLREGIGEAAVAVLLVSKRYLSQPFIIQTELPLIEQEKASRGLHVLPAILNRCEWRHSPVIEQATICPNEGRTFAQLSEDERDAWIHRLVGDILEASGAAPSRVPSGPTPSTILPGPPLLGREDEIAAVRRLLRANRGVILFGAPGQGKTALARAVATTDADAYPDGIYEVDLENEIQIENLPRLIAMALGSVDAASSYSQIGGRNALLLLDGIDGILRAADPARLRKHLSLLLGVSQNGSRFIITSRERFEKSGFAAKLVPPLDPSASVALFVSVLGDYPESEEDMIREFVNTDLAGHPLSIKIVARFGTNLRLPLSELMRLWREKWSEIARFSPSLDDRALYTSFELTYGTLSTDEQLLFVALSLLPDGVDTALIRAVWGNDDAKIYAALHMLSDRSLLDEREPKRSSLRLSSPLLRFAATKRVELEAAGSADVRDRLAARTEAIDVYMDRFVREHAPQSADADPRAKIALLRGAFHNVHASIDRRLEPSAKEAALSAAESVRLLYWAYHNKLSGADSATSSTDDAIRYLSKAQEVFLANGKSDPARYCQYYIGNILWLSGDTEKAKLYLTDVHDGGSQPTPMHCDSARAFAHIEYKEGSLQRSVELYEQAIQRALSIGYEECVHRAQIGLIDAHRKLENFAAALAVFKDMAPHLERIHPNIAGNALRGRAYVLAAQGHLEAAEEQYNWALAKFETALAAFGLAHCRRGLGDVFVRQGRLPEARDSFETALRLYRDSGKEPSLGIGLVVLGLSRLAIASDDRPEALKQARTAAHMFDRQNLNEPYELAVSHELTAEIHAAMGDLQNARGSGELALNYFERVGAVAVAARLRSQIANWV